ncbi:protein kinase [Gemmatirosa kalamazoonensis]|uniref:non-specific serine/threonine protein kinase n=1 Tax=Gemmatirosa kalamazoonensis TaxID=861299 RepID=W0RCY3_9BACT|nr:serine/threonine-protein kinase [Gemmatirosa kalamazoonensis]AHG88292.1 protein kinase [Gemmatirosa kalamazoonensis]
MTDSGDALSAPSGGAPGADDSFRDALAAALAPAYVLGRELHGGGMSRVFVAEEPALGRTVVVKVLPLEWAAGMNRDRFLREIQLAARLQHPHIVPLLAAGEVAGSMYYTMPFIEGESVRAALARGRRFTVREVVRILHDVVEALAHAHARGVIHRDVKPGNVLMLGNHALVTDFGVAKALSAARQSTGGVFAAGTTSTGLAIGTPAYMAPEQLAADPAADHRVDLYAAGLLAYELLVGQSPFTADSPQATLAAQLTRVPTALHTLRPDVPAALSAVIERCLAKEPAQRPASAEDLLGALEAAAYHVTPGGGTPADAVLGGITPPETAPVTAPLGTVPNVLTAPLPAGAAEATTTRLPAPSASHRRPTAVLGGALLGMALVLLGGWAVVRGLGDRGAATPKVPNAPAAPAGVVAPAVSAPAVPAPAVPVVTPRLTRDDSLAIAAAVERRLAGEERARRAKDAKPMAPQQAESLRAVSWQHFADSLRDAAMGLARGHGPGPGRVIVGMPDLRRMVPDSATMSALARAGASGAAGAVAGVGSRFEMRVDPRVAREDALRSEAAAWIAKLGERLPPPKPGVRRVLVLDLGDGTGRPDLRGLAGAVTAATRRAISQRDGYEAIDPSTVKDVQRMGLPEGALAAVTHSGAVLGGLVTVQRDSTVGVVAVIHDAARGFPFSVRTARTPASTSPDSMAADVGAALVKALDRVKWPPRPDERP